MADFDEMAQYSDSTERRARKDHVCTECCRRISRGETYHYDTLIYDGSVSNFKTCAHCQVAKIWLMENCNGYLYEGVREDVQEHVMAFRGEDNALSWRMLRMWHGMRNHWQRNGKLMSIPKKIRAPIRDMRH